MQNPSIGNVPRSLPFPVSPTLPQMPNAVYRSTYNEPSVPLFTWPVPVSHDTAYVGRPRLGPDSLTTAQVR